MYAYITKINYHKNMKINFKTKNWFTNKIGQNTPFDMYIEIKWFLHFFLEKDKNIQTSCGSSTFSNSFAMFHEWEKIVDAMLWCRNHILFHFPFII